MGLIYRMMRQKCRSLRRMFQKLFPLRMTIETLRGGWHDSDEQILHANFQILVNYVEKECAWMNIVFSSDEWNELPLIQRLYLICGGTLRSRRHGTKYLQWESDLRDDNGKPTPQATTAKQIYDLYWWWTIMRPKRVDPYSKIDVKFDWAWWGNNEPLTDEEKRQLALWTKQSDAANLLEEQYYQEDNDQLKKLMDLRSSLWT